jgi:hypothetical protein
MDEEALERLRLKKETEIAFAAHRAAEAATREDM